MTNDMQSLKLCSKLHPDAYVIAASCFVEENLVKAVAEEKLPVILRSGGATLGEIENTINIIKENQVEDIIILHGFQSYPTRIEDSRIRLIPTFRTTFGLPVGLADHIDAESHLAMIVPLVAMGFGAAVIEKHVTHDRSLKGEDFESALNPHELKKLVSDIREIEKSFGPDSFGPLSPEEVRYRQVSRKRTVAARYLSKGTKISSQDIVFKRADEGIYPDDSKYIIDRVTGIDIKEDDPITLDKLL
jgi:sialic acid synthase SpsE